MSLEKTVITDKIASRLQSGDWKGIVINFQGELWQIDQSFPQYADEPQSVMIFTIRDGKKVFKKLSTNLAQSVVIQTLTSRISDIELILGIIQSEVNEDVHLDKLLNTILGNSQKAITAIVHPDWVE